MAEIRASNPLVDQIRRGGVPLDVREMAAEGALPLKPDDLVELLELMSHDPEPAIASQALKTFVAMAVDEVAPILKAKDTPPDVLGWALTVREESKLREACLQNTGTPDLAIVGVAARLSEQLAELVVINQTRLLRCLPLLEAIESNRSLSRDQKRRLDELRDTFAIGVERKDVEEVAIRPQARPEEPPPQETPPEEQEKPAVEAPAAKPEAPATPVVPENAVEMSPDQAVAQILTDEEKEDEESVSQLTELFNMKTGQKIKAALKGDARVRSFLIRDPNRLVATAVLGSPKITEAEVEQFSAMKNVSDEVLRRIAANKDWTKKYSVFCNLAKNPRTPLPVAMSFIPRLMPKDLKSIAVDRNVPEAIRKQAQRFVKGQGDKK